MACTGSIKIFLPNCEHIPNIMPIVIVQQHVPRNFELSGRKAQIGNIFLRHARSRFSSRFTKQQHSRFALCLKFLDPQSCGIVDFLDHVCEDVACLPVNPCLYCLILDAFPYP